MDRTHEFNTLLTRLHGGFASDSKRHEHPPVRAQSQSDVNVLAKEISHALATSSLRVSELRKLAKSTTLFDDKTCRIQQLSFHVSGDIESLRTKISRLEEQVKLAQTRHDSRSHSINMVAILKLRLDEVIKEAKLAVEDRSNAMQRREERKHHISFSRHVSAGSVKSCDRQGQKPPLLPLQVQDLENNGELVQAEVSRLDAVNKLQGAIGELATMFTQTASIVHAHQEMMERVDSDLDAIQSNVRDANNEILEFWRRISSNRTLIMKVFAILVVFVLFFVLFLAD